MGFALWIGEEVAWAEGTHEYRPMGAAAVAVTDLFSPRDFRPARKRLARGGPEFAGLFASLGAMNDYLRRRRAGRVPKPAGLRSLPYF